MIMVKQLFKLGLNIKVFIRKIQEMDMVSNNLKMVYYIKDIGKMTWKREKDT